MTRAENIAVVIAGLAGTFALLSHRAIKAAPLWTVANVRAVAGTTVRGFKLNVDPAMIPRIAWIESSNRATSPEDIRFNPAAVHFEPRTGDTSAGLMQTLLSTARWLATDMGYDAFGVPNLDDLLQSPQASIYFGAAYLDYLSRYRGRARGEEFIVRSYNGGPGNTGSATADYWRKYNRAREALG